MDKFIETHDEGHVTDAVSIEDTIEPSTATDGTLVQVEKYTDKVG